MDAASDRRTRARQLYQLLQASWKATTPESAATARRALDEFYAQEDARLHAATPSGPLGAHAGRAIALAATALLSVGVGGLVWSRYDVPAQGLLAVQTGPWQASPSLVGPGISPQALRPGETVVLPRIEGPLLVDIAVRSMVEPPPKARLHATAFFLHGGGATLVYRADVAAGERFAPDPLQVPLPLEDGELVFLVVDEPLPDEILATPDRVSVLALLDGDLPKWSARIPVEAP